MLRWSPSAAASRPEVAPLAMPSFGHSRTWRRKPATSFGANAVAPRAQQLKPDRGDGANIFFQHLRGEIFSKGQLSDLSAEFCRDFKGELCQPDREFESYPLRHLVHCFSREISIAEIIAEVPRVRLAKVGAIDRRERGLENDGALCVQNSLFGDLAVRLGRRAI
jgi:hypothetical protein